MSEIDPGDTVKLLAEHYQKTFDLTYEYKVQRNKYFLLLLAVIGGGTILFYSDDQINASIIAGIIANALNISDQNTILMLQKSIPISLLHSILLYVVYYLMVNLYNRAANVIRQYSYLGEMEIEIRALLGFGSEKISFTRESTYYWGNRPRLFGTVKWAYTFLLGLLVTAFLGIRLYWDFSNGIIVLGVLDLLISILILIYFFAYAKVSVSQDKSNPRKAMLEESE